MTYKRGMRQVEGEGLVYKFTHEASGMGKDWFTSLHMRQVEGEGLVYKFTHEASGRGRTGLQVYT